MTRFLIALAVVAGAPACAALGEGECRSSDWYQLGFRDALFGLQPQDWIYAQQCERSGV